MTTPNFASEAALAGDYPSTHFNQRERKILESTKVYIDAQSPSTVITTQGDLIVGNAGGDAARLAKGTSGLPLVAGASTVSYAALTDTGLASNAVTTAKITDLNVTTSKLAADAVDGTKLADDAVSVEHLDSGIEYSHRVFAAGEFTTAGGDAAESIAASGALATDLAFVFLKTPGVSPVTVLNAAAGTDAIAVNLSADPSTDHVLCWQLLRAAT